MFDRHFFTGKLGLAALVMRGHDGDLQRLRDEYASRRVGACGFRRRVSRGPSVSGAGMSEDDGPLRPIPRPRSEASRLDREIERLRTSPTPANNPLSSGGVWMGIFSRTRDIIAANFNDLLDQADDPAKMIRMIIMEMEETLVEVRASAARTIADQKEMHRHTVKLDKLQTDWAEKAQLALSKDREDLARAALLEKKQAGDMADQLKQEIAVLDDALRAYEQDIAKLQNRLREARSRQTQIAARLESAENRVKLRSLMTNERVDDALAALRPARTPGRLCRRPRRRAVDRRRHRQAKPLGRDRRARRLRQGRRRTRRNEARARHGRCDRQAGGLTRGRRNRHHPGYLHRPAVDHPPLHHQVEDRRDDHQRRRGRCSRNSTTSPSASTSGWTRSNAWSPPTTRTSSRPASRHDKRNRQRAAARTRSPAGRTGRPQVTSKHTTLYRDKQNAKLMGVCAGIADYTGVNVAVGPARRHRPDAVDRWFGIPPTSLAGLLLSKKPRAPLRRQGRTALLAARAAEPAAHRPRDPRPLPRRRSPPGRSRNLLCDQQPAPVGRNRTAALKEKVRRCSIRSSFR